MNNTILTYVVIAALVFTGIGSFVGSSINTNGLERVLGTALDYEAAQSQLATFNFLQDLVEDIGYSTTTTWDPGAVGATSVATTSITLSGVSATSSDIVSITSNSTSTNDTGWFFTGHVTAATAVTIALHSPTSTVNLETSTLTIRIASSTPQSSVSSSP